MIALIDHLVPFGGAEVLVASIAARLDLRRFEPIVCASRSADDGVVRDLHARGVRTVCLHRDRRFALGPWREMTALLREAPSVLHAHKFGSNAWGAFLRQIAPVPVLIGHEHVWSFEGKPLRRMVDNLGIGRVADVLLTVSQDTREKMISVEGLQPSRVAVFTHGVPSLRRSEAPDLRLLGATEDDFIIGTVCVLRPQKAIDDLLRATAILKSRIPRLRVVIIGDGPERRSLERMAAALSLDDTVAFIGHRDDADVLVGTFDVFVLSSRYEGSPLAVMEAMAAGRPVVATAVGGVPEIVEDGLDGVLVPASSPATIATSVEWLYEHRDLRRSLGERAQRKHARYFDLDKNVRKLEELYQALFDHAGGRPRRRGTESAAKVARQVLSY